MAVKEKKIEKAKVLEVKEETKPATIPIDQSKLSPLQQEISGYVSTAKKEPPRITDVNELFTKIEMEIPKGVSRGPEYSYCWLSVDEIRGLTGSKWEIVNRNNHSHVPDRVFDMSGAILYKGQNILAFCYREARELEQEAIVNDFNKKTEKITKTEDQASEREVRNIPINHAGSVVSGGLVDTFAEPAGYAPDKDDF